MSHLLSVERLARLKANIRAYKHFLEHQTTYARYSARLLGLAKTFPDDFGHWENVETRIDLVKEWIKSMDPSIWGLKTDWMTSDEIADSFARMVVGHET